jgi:hypothetical protein
MIRQQVDADTGDCCLPDNAEIGDYSPGAKSARTSFADLVIPSGACAVPPLVVK